MPVEDPEHEGAEAVFESGLLVTADVIKGVKDKQSVTAVNYSVKIERKNTESLDILFITTL